MVVSPDDSRHVLVCGHSLIVEDELDLQISVALIESSTGSAEPCS